MRRVTAALSGLALAASTLAATPATADPQDTCQDVPLHFNKNLSAGASGKQYTIKANLTVFDDADAAPDCTDGTITDTIGIKGRNGTSLRAISPTLVKVYYRTSAADDTHLHGDGVQVDKRDALEQGFRTYDVSTDDIPLDQGVYFTQIVVVWVVSVHHTGGTSQYQRAMTCDRIHTDGANAYHCAPGFPK